MSSIKISSSDCFKINTSCTLVLENDCVNIEYDFKDGEYNVLIFNNYEKDCKLLEKGNVVSSNVKINYLQLEKGNLIHDVRIEVNKDSSLFINATYLGINKKEINFDLYNNESDSIVEISNNIVCVDKADFSLNCIGTIKKGAKRSKCHQKSHCLTIDNPIKAKVLPVLNIDEDDVEASHSLSSGTIDEEILYYMNSRGLSSKEALGLILKSYLMPNERYYDGFEDGDTIQKAAILKVDEVCSM